MSKTTKLILLDSLLQEMVGGSKSGCKTYVCSFRYRKSPNFVDALPGATFTTNKLWDRDRLKTRLLEEIICTIGEYTCPSMSFDNLSTKYKDQIRAYLPDFVFPRDIMDPEDIISTLTASVLMQLSRRKKRRRTRRRTRSVIDSPPCRFLSS